MTKVAYLAHDLADAAIGRRIRMLQRGGAEVVLAGFYRSDLPPAAVAGVKPIPLGRTENGQFAKRVWAVVRTLGRIGELRRAFGDVDVILARQLEMLAVGAALRRGSKAKLVYELLDVHRLMLAKPGISPAMRRLERALLKDSNAVVVSSPAFAARYLHAMQATTKPILLVENKVFDPDSEGVVEIPREPPPAPPWRIAFLGVLRCRKSLVVLADLVRALPGLVEVDLHGIPARNEIPDFDDLVAVPGMRFHGRYAYPGDLARIYSAAHFVWTIDFYEEGLNSSWLLPNRLYEGCACGAVPIVLADVETARWLARHQVGVTLPQPLQASLVDFFRTLTESRFEEMRQAVDRLPRASVRTLPEECTRLVDDLAGC